MSTVTEPVTPAPEPTIRTVGAVAVMQQLAPTETWTARKVYRLAERGQIPHRRIGASVVFLESELRHWWNNGGTDLAVLAARRREQREARAILGRKRRITRA